MGVPGGIYRRISRLLKRYTTISESGRWMERLRKFMIFYAGLSENRREKPKHPRREVLIVSRLKQPQMAVLVATMHPRASTSVRPAGLRLRTGKKTKGRKRHICVDTLGLIWSLVVHEAHIQDRDGAKLVFLGLMKTISSILLIWADGGYAGPLLLGWLQQQNWNWKLEIVKRTDDMKGFVLLPHRWIVERTFGWLENYRLLAKEYEKSVTSSQSNIYMAMIQIMARRLEA